MSESLLCVLLRAQLDDAAVPPTSELDGGLDGLSRLPLRVLERTRSRRACWSVDGARDVAAGREVAGTVEHAQNLKQMIAHHFGVRAQVPGIGSGHQLLTRKPSGQHASKWALDPVQNQTPQHIT